MGRKWKWWVLLLVIGVGLAAWTGSRQADQERIVYDDEQRGLQKQIIIYFSHVVAENTPKGLAAQKFAELVEQKTNGRVKVEVFANGSLYSDGEELDALLRGDVQMIAPSFSKVTELIPEWQVLDLPFLFHDDNDVRRVFTGKVGAELLGMLEEKGIKGLALWSNGFKQMMGTTRPLVEPDDFRGLRFRIMPSEVIDKQFRLLGGEPVAVSFDRVYRALERHEFDGQENTISNIYSKGFYKFQPYITISNHGYLGYAVMMNQSFWNSLPKEIQQNIAEAMDEATRWNLRQSKAQNERELQQLKRREDVHLYLLSETEKRRWERKLAPLYQEFTRRFGSRLLNEIKKSDE
ncbi:C4-dicarboxylate ABC transporter [Geobacillus subterraneus]|uniref:C4-dicarboxylate ABC transporter n=2 Tax=Geobacillus TaxID=129337 RepID=A0ABN4NIM0_9BACL|nr:MULTISPECIES: TRAP transporter substrate-binding protein [Geobacillus]AMX84521.1 C4-dicarboxylate ABC transporter [Geobacillus subterraneus]KZS24712.1 C4-dicarboxylate ABC transporter [Geobacillus subterraneus]OXB87561.1 C4-dicarboxylate ABC transporter [Geobacillus uzenensis]QIZ66719.1 TRAP transporter substrate-binding protein [Geobacillus subterraneus]WPZ18944.1 TRAP transporter substrate-binding protein [Geobacillus subterraneus]